MEYYQLTAAKERAYWAAYMLLIAIESAPEAWKPDLWDMAQKGARAAKHDRKIFDSAEEE